MAVNFLKSILANLARITLRVYKPDVIGITGTVGKTSAKEAITALLSNRNYSLVGDKERWRVRKSAGNLNTELGMPLTILGYWDENDLKIVSRGQKSGAKKLQKLFFWLKVILRGYLRLIIHSSKYPKILVLEYGADRPGDLKILLNIVKPKIGVMTAVGEIPVHIEFYKNINEVVKEKSRLVESLPVNGYAILNNDDEHILRAREKIKANTITFGFSNNSDVRISNFENLSENKKPKGIFFKLEYKGSFVPITLINIFGRAQAYAIAGAVCVGIAYEMNLVECAELIERFYFPVRRRMNLLGGINDSFIIDDSYNASPLSMNEALSTVKDLDVVRKIGILGDMLELGKFSENAHREIGRLVADVLDVLVTVGSGGKIIAEEALKKGIKKENIFSFDRGVDCLDLVKSIIKEGDLVLIKASRGIGLDKVVDEISR